MEALEVYYTVNFLKAGMTSARQNRKSQALLPQETEIQQYTDQFPCNKSKNQLRDSCSQTDPKRNQLHRIRRKIYSTHSPEPLLLAQHGAARRKFPTPGFSLRAEKEDWTIYLIFRLVRGPPEGLVSVLPELGIDS